MTSSLAIDTLQQNYPTTGALNGPMPQAVMGNFKMISLAKVFLKRKSAVLHNLRKDIYHWIRTPVSPTRCMSALLQ
jgi:hypothetical protein